jgi:hypothetical protein
MATLRTELHTLASSFVSAVLTAVKDASLTEVAGEIDGAGRRAGRTPRAAAATPRAPRAAAAGGRARRRRSSAEEVQHQKDIALATAKQLKPNFSKGDVMRKSGSKVDLGRALTLLVADGKLKKKGDRRLTRYTVK